MYEYKPEQRGIINISNSTDLAEQGADTRLLDLAVLNDQTQTLLQHLISTTDLQQTKDLTYLFNINQNKKTTVRISKLNSLLDLITDQALRRLRTRPDQISNKQLLDSLRIVQTSIQNSQRQVAGELEAPAPFIQINNQTNEVNIGNTAASLDRDSRNRVKTAVLGILKNLQQAGLSAQQPVVQVELSQEDTTDEQ